MGSLRIMKYNPQTIPRSRDDGANAMSQSHPVIATRTQYRSMLGWKDETFTLIQRNDMTSALCPWSLFDE